VRRRSFGQRIIAVVAAYAVILSSLLVSLGNARAVAANVAGIDGIICRTASTGLPDRNGDDGTKVCVDACCIGCLTVVAALPPPPPRVIGVLPSSLRSAKPVSSIAFGFGYKIKSHRTRGPPSPG
jgi:hypothetical protein